MSMAVQDPTWGAERTSGGGHPRTATLSAGVLLVAALACSQVAAVTPRQLVEVADLGNLMVSPDGGSVAFRLEQASVERNTYDSVWYVQTLDGGVPPRRLAEGGAPLRDTAGLSLPSPATWSPDGRWLYYLAAIEGRVDVWRAATDGSGAAPLTQDAADVRRFEVSEDGRVLRYSVGATREEVERAEQREYERGIHVDERSPVGQGLFRSDYVAGRLATQRLGPVWFERVPLLDEVPDRWKTIDLVSGIRKDLPSGEQQTGSQAHPRIAGGDTVPWKTVKQPGSGRIATLTRTGERHGQRDAPEVVLSVRQGTGSLRTETCDAKACKGAAITEVVWMPRRNEVVFTVTDHTRGLAQSLFRWDIQANAVTLILHAEGSVGGGGRWDPGACSASPAVLVCVAAEAGRPPRLESIDLASGARTVLFEPNGALMLEVAAGTEVRLLRWRDEKGRAFTGQFFPARTNNGRPTPLFINYYRCAGFLRGGVGDEWPFAVLAAHGISALCINQLEGYTLDAAERHDQARAAVRAIVRELAASGQVDADRVGMGGLSYGGAATLWTAAESDLLAAASVSSPVVSPNYYLLGSLKGAAFTEGLRALWGLGAPDETPGLWRALSPVFKLDRVAIPILFQKSEREYMYGADYIIPLIRENRADLYVFPHEPHQKYQPKHKLAVYERNVDWFRFWLQGVEDDDASKHGQYARWRVIRQAFAR